MVTWLNPSLDLFDLICVVVFIRWPGSLFPSTHHQCGTVVRQLRQTKTCSIIIDRTYATASSVLFPQQCSQTSMFPFSHSKQMSATHPLLGMGGQCCISIDNSSLTVPCGAQPSSSVNFMVRFSICGRSLILLQPPRLINMLTSVAIDARSYSERYCLIRQVWNQLKNYYSLLCLATLTILSRI